MKVLACYAVKGGVGKTSAAVNLAWLAASSGLRTVVWDLDPQSAATFLLRGKPKVRGGSRELLVGTSDPAKALRVTDHDGLWLLPSNPDYLTAVTDLHEAKRGRTRVRSVVRALDDVDLVVVDCAAGSSLVGDNVIRAADVVLTPLVPSPLSLRTLDQVVDGVTATNPKARVVAFLSMVERRRALHREVMALVEGRYADIARTPIPSSALVERMGQRRRPVVASAPSSGVATAYRDLWAELAQRLDLVAAVPGGVVTAAD